MNNKFLILSFNLSCALLFSSEVADVKERNKRINTYKKLIIAGDHAGVEALVSANPELRSVKVGGCQSVLHVAINLGHLGLAEYLIKLGDDVKKRNESGDTLLHTVYKPFEVSKSKVIRGNSFNLRVAQLLVDAGLHVNDRNRSEHTPLHYAILVSDKESVKYMLANGADVCAVNSFGLSPLHLARLVLDPKFSANYCSIGNFYENFKCTDEDKQEILAMLEKHMLDLDKADSLAESVRMVSDAQAAASSEQAANTSTSAMASTGGYVDSILRFFRIR